MGGPAAPPCPPPTHPLSAPQAAGGSPPRCGAGKRHADGCRLRLPPHRLQERLPTARHRVEEYVSAPGHPKTPPPPPGILGVQGIPTLTPSLPRPGEPDKAIIDDMWLGVTVASQRQPAGRVLVSARAPRFFAHVPRFFAHAPRFFAHACAGAEPPPRATARGHQGAAGGFTWVSRVSPARWHRAEGTVGLLLGLGAVG